MASKKKKHRGRPALNERHKRSKVMAIRFTQAEYNQLQKEAKEAGQNLTEYLRQYWQKARE